MKLQLEQHEIEQAVREYVANQGIKVEGKELTLKFTMTRGDAGLLADLSIDEPKPVETNKAKAKLGSVGAIIRDQGKSEPADPKPKVDPAAAKAAIDKAMADAAASKEAKETAAAAEQTAVGSDAAVPAAETEETVAAATEEAKEEAPATSGPAKSLFG